MMTTKMANRSAARRTRRRDPEAARRTLENLFPAAELRRHLLEIAARTIEHAHATNPAAWSVTLGANSLVINVGRVLALRFKGEEVLAILARQDLGLIDGRDASKEELYKSVPEAVWRRFDPQRFSDLWPRLDAAHLAGIEAAARVKRTPYYLSHSPGVLDYLEHVLGRSMPRPEHGEAAGRVTPAIVRQLVDRVHRSFPQWDGFSHPDFVDDEITYKRKASAEAQQLLGREPLEALLGQGNYEEILQRLRTVAQSVNLLYLGTPSSGNLAVLHAPELDRPAFCQAVFELLHGDGDSPARLDRFSRYVEEQRLPNKWTFPTFFLFLLDPEHDFFVKPGVTRWFLGLLDVQDLYSPEPSGEAYADILQLVFDLAEALAEFGPQDMIDIQSLLFVAYWGTERLEAEERRDAEAVLPTEQDSTFEVRPELPLLAIATQTSLDVGLLERWVRALERKKQAILYGPPGTGKTHVARLLADHLAGGGDGLVELVQFHPSMSYEDFIQGIRPDERPGGGLAYPLRRGRFLDFCDRAQERQGTSVLIIDEINRAELSRVFGELMYLLEYRDQAIPLAAGGEPFAIPASVRLVGTMNTADRSIALVDHALRRRFAFLRLEPKPDLLRAAHRDSAFPVDKLILVLERINHEIGDPHYALGVTYFLTPDLDTALADIWQMEIEPYLEEYFFDRPKQVDAFRWPRVRESLSS